MQIRTPTRDELLAAAARTVPDVIGPEIEVLFCGISPEPYTAFVGHHFAHPGNRFWKALHTAGFTDRLLDPSGERQLLAYGYGLTYLVERAAATAAELSGAELATGRWRLETKVLSTTPPGGWRCSDSGRTGRRSDAHTQLWDGRKIRSQGRVSGCSRTPAAGTPTTGRRTSPGSSGSCGPP